jgi:hypothetical protein
MIEITAIEVEGKTSRGEFRGAIELQPGLNVLSAENAYGKSLAMTAIPWCLGLEAMFGLQNNDPSRFPVAVRDVISLGAARDVEVASSLARLSLRRDDGATLTITRPIKGTSLEIVEVVEGGPSARTSRLRARRDTMVDETGGLQHFLFDWMRLPHALLMTLKGTQAELYLENLAPLFFIDQNEGWTDLQALQVYRYQIQEVAEAAVEYMLGAHTALEARLRRQQRVSTEARLKGEAEKIAEQAVEFFRRQGWDLKWSTFGSSADIAKRWSTRTLGAVARDDFRMDPAAERTRLQATIANLQRDMASDPVGAMESAPSTQASQSVIELKTRRHTLRWELRGLRLQLADHRALLETTEHRIHSSKDVLRLKTLGIGRLDTVECPTCHRDLDPSTFDLKEQSVPSVQAQIESLEKQRSALLTNIATLESHLTRLDHDIAKIDSDLQNADRALDSVNRAVGTVRERFSKLAFDVAAAQRELDGLNAFTTELAELESKVTRWLEEVRTGAEEGAALETDLADRVGVFAEKLRVQLLDLGFSAVTRVNAKKVSFDDRYIPYLDTRRLRSLGSASDHARLIAAYVLALADASRAKGGPHPGLIVLDEPLQQNPDPKHRKLMLRFFEQTAAATKSQVIVTTSLQPEELGQLRKAHVNVRALPGKKFLQPTKPDKAG